MSCIAGLGAESLKHRIIEYTLHIDVLGTPWCAQPVVPLVATLASPACHDTVCIRLCDAGPLYSSLLRNHI